MFFVRVLPCYALAMPSYTSPGHLKATIVARVAAGETVVEIALEAGMPSASCVQVWRRADAGFAGELAAARVRGEWIRRRRFDEAVAAFVARLAAGATVRSLLGTPGMPSQWTYRYWRATDVGFQAALWRLQGAREERRLVGLKGRYRPWDEAMADRVLLAVMRGATLRSLLASDKAFPSLAVLARWRWEEPVWDKALRMAMRAGRRARRREPPKALAEEIGERIVRGASLRSLGAEPDMPCAATLYAWVKRWPAFAAEVARACDWREEFLNDQMIDIAERNGPFALAATKREAAPLQLRVNQLAKRPGWTRAPEAPLTGRRSVR